jgi:hypothetical protein
MQAPYHWHHTAKDEVVYTLDSAANPDSEKTHVTIGFF